MASDSIRADAPTKPRREGRRLRRGGLATALVWLPATPVMAAESLELVPDYGLFGWFGDSGFGHLWVMVLLFSVLIFPLNELLFKPIFRALDARAERIAGAQQRSKSLQAEADAVLVRYEKAIREARSASEAERQKRLEKAREEQVQLAAQARAEAERELEQARGSLTRSVEEARSGLRASAEELARAAAERVLGRPVQ